MCRKFKNPKLSYIFVKAPVDYVFWDKYLLQLKIFKEENLVKILKLLGLIKRYEEVLDEYTITLKRKSGWKI